jgi:hypothetical protein
MVVLPKIPRTLLITTAAIEFAASVPLLIAPSLVVSLLLGTQLSSPASLLVARIAGAALLAIGVSCWLEGRRPDPAPLTGLLSGLLVYNLAVCVLMIYAALVDRLRGVGIWPACALHLAMTAWCAWVILQARLGHALPTTNGRT